MIFLIIYFNDIFIYLKMIKNISKISNTFFKNYKTQFTNKNEKNVPSIKIKLKF